MGEDEEFALGVVDEGGGFEGSLVFGAFEDFLVGGFFVFVVEGPEVAEAPVAVEVLALEGGDGFAVIVEASGNGNAAEAVVFVDGVDEFGVFWRLN